VFGWCSWCVYWCTRSCPAQVGAERWCGHVLCQESSWERRVARICRDERVFRRARAVEAPPACGTARRLVQTRSGLLAGASLRDRADVHVGADIDGVVVAWALHRLWPIKWARNLCRKEAVTCLSELSQDTSRLAAAAFSQTPCVRTVHLLPRDVSLSIDC
jgi:hypothetical protein